MLFAYGHSIAVLVPEMGRVDYGLLRTPPPHTQVQCLPFWVPRTGLETGEQQGLPFQGLAGCLGCFFPEDGHRGGRDPFLACVGTP